MARNFDGTNDNLTSADNAVTGLNDNAQSYGAWVRLSVQPTVNRVFFNTMTAVGAGNALATMRVIVPGVAGFRYQFLMQFSTQIGRWSYATDLNLDQRYHIATTMNGASASNDPVITIDGVDVTVTEDTTPSGSRTTGDDTVRFGEDAAGTSDFNGDVQHCSGEGGVIWTAAEKNRHRWWGRARSAGVLCFPLLTAQLANLGSSVFSLTASGTTVVPFATPVVRPGSAMMGMGIGW